MPDDQPGRGGRGEIGGVDKRIVMAGGAALLVGLAYFWWKGRQSSATAGTAAADTTGTGLPGTPASSATGLSWEQFLLWLHDWQSSSTTTTPPPKPKPKPKPKTRPERGV